MGLSFFFTFQSCFLCWVISCPLDFCILCLSEFLGLCFSDEDQIQSNAYFLKREDKNKKPSDETNDNSPVSIICFGAPCSFSIPILMVNFIHLKNAILWILSDDSFSHAVAFISFYVMFFLFQR